MLTEEGGAGAKGSSCACGAGAKARGEAGPAWSSAPSDAKGSKGSAAEGVTLFTEGAETEAGP